MKKIQVTKTFLPPIAEYQNYVQAIWESGWITNHGPLVNTLERELKSYLDVPHFHFVTNGTLALQIAIKALGLSGEIITTPFSYVATTSSILWENCEPIMVDILPTTLNIDPTQIESAITEKTSAILATHVYGNPCDVREIQRIADKHNLKVIYDAAHAFGVTLDGTSLFNFGDIATTSFHATKVFHTTEGGGIFTQDAEISHRISMLRNFGHANPTEFVCVGINGKNSEFHAAMGLTNLRHIQTILKNRAILSQCYDAYLKTLPIKKPMLFAGCAYNYAYYPVIFETEAIMLHVLHVLNQHHIYPRRYFYPSLSNLNYLTRKFDVPVCNDIASRIVCLPLFHDLSTEEVRMICAHIMSALELAATVR